MQEKLATGTNDAQQEELIGRTFNLMEGSSCSVPNTFQIIIVAQTIRDLQGDVVRQDSKSGIVKATDDCSATVKGLGGKAVIGQFDAHIGSNLGESIYYDEILSECRMLVTVEKIHYMEGDNPRTRLRVKQIEYLD